MSEEIAALAKDVRERMDAIGQRLSDEALEQRITTAVTAAVEPFERKIRHGAEDALKGSKFGRMGLVDSDVEFLHALLTGAGKRVSDDLGNYIKTRAMDTAESGYGSQLIGAQYVGELWAGARAQSKIFALLPSFEMTAPTAYFPVAAAPPELTFVAENTANNSSNYGTVKTGSQRVTVSASKFVIHQMWSGEMEEDAIIPFIPFLRAEQTFSLAHYADSLVINGDTTNAATLNINSYDADPADTKHYLAFDGIRHAALVDNTGNAASASGSLDYSQILGLKTLMVDRTYFDDWGHPVNPDDLIFAVGPEGADAIANLDEVLTVDKYGPQAVVLNGEVARIGRHPLIASIAVPMTNNDGMVKSTGNSYDQIVAFNRRAFVVGVRRALKIETERLPATDQSRIVLSTRLGLGRYSPTGAASGIEGAAVLYYI